MEARIARLESDVAHISSNVADIKLDVRALRDRMDTRIDRVESKLDELDAKFDRKYDSLQDKLSRAQIWALFLYIALATGTFGTMARAFGWI